jgi:HK97 family phage prohead protease
MTTATATIDEVEKREVGEKVKVAALFEAGKTKDLGRGVLECIVSTGSEDRHREMINPDGIDLKHYKKNPVVLYGHDYEALPIGKCLSIKKVDGKIVARFQLAIDEYPFAKTVYDLIVGGYLNDVSIGGIVVEWSDDYMTIEQLEMVEFSVVNIGANRDAKIVARSIGKSLDELQSEYQDFVHHKLFDKIDTMDETEVNQAIKVLKNLLATLEESAKAASTAGKNEPNEVRRIKHITLRDSAKAVATQSQRVIKTIKLTTKG